ncbi:MAG: MFS transporter [Lachnospiraceae bacterium]|nr:MFS transporter [Lachnospiraceae bacterium]
MSTKMSKTKFILFCAALILTHVISMHDMVIYPIVNNLYEMFYENMAGVNFIISGPAIFMFFASLLAPYLMKFIDKKTLLVICCVIFAVFSIGGSAIVSVPYIIAARSICGFVYGIVQVVVIGIVADHFIDDNKRATFMGVYNAGMAAIGAVMSAVAGVLAVSGWRNAYYTYLISIPMLLLVIFFVPRIQSRLEAAQENTPAAAAGKSRFGAKFWIMLVNFFILCVAYTPMMMMTSVYIAENNLGNEALAGLAGSVGTIGSGVFCLLFGFVYSKLKARTSLISYAGMALGLLGMYFIKGPVIFLIICTVAGATYGFLYSYMFTQVTLLVAPEDANRAISYLTAIYAASIFLGPYVTTWIMGMVGNSITVASLIFGIVCAACLVLEYFNTTKMSAAG